MALTLAEALPFAASIYFVLFGSTFTGKPFDRFQEQVAADIAGFKQQLADRLAKPADADAVRNAGGLYADAIRRQAQDASALSGLPQKALLTGIGFCFLWPGWPAAIGSALLVSLALGVQQRTDMHNQKAIGFARISVAGALLIVLNIGGLVAAAVSPT